MWNKKQMKREWKARRLRSRATGNQKTKWSKPAHRGRITRVYLEEHYLKRYQSMQGIAGILGCSLHKIAYWMDKYKIDRRSRSEAMYVVHNSEGDPFKFKEPRTVDEAKLFGLGLGLYWGEGTRANKTSIRLGNTDPALIKKFIEFLLKIYGIKKSDLKFALQIFSDMNPESAVDFWVKELKINRTQFNKVIVTKSGSLGTYRRKSEFGVLTVMYHNRELRDLIIDTLPR